MKIILQWLIVAGAVLATSYIVPGISVASFYIALIVALVWGVFSLSIKPILHILTLPITILTLGLFSLVINGLLFWFISTFIKGFQVESFVSAILGAFAVSIITWFLGLILLPKED